MELDSRHTANLRMLSVTRVDKYNFDALREFFKKGEEGGFRQVQ